MSCAQSSFDADFAESMSKPLPEWFLEQEALRKKQLIEMEEKSKKMLEEFRAKYIISELEKVQAISKVREDKKMKMKQQLQKKGESVKDEDIDDELTTQEKWDIFFKEEEESTGFRLPGFFEVFPELKLKWPIWAKKNGKAIKCETDSDCQFPQACCSHPILPGDKFCCTGWVAG